MLFNYNKLNYYYENRDKELKNEINNLQINYQIIINLIKEMI